MNQNQSDWFAGFWAGIAIAFFIAMGFVFMGEAVNKNKAKNYAQNNCGQSVAHVISYRSKKDPVVFTCGANKTIKVVESGK